MWEDQSHGIWRRSGALQLPRAVQRAASGWRRPNDITAPFPLFQNTCDLDAGFEPQNVLLDGVLTLILLRNLLRLSTAGTAHLAGLKGEHSSGEPWGFPEP